MEVGHAPLINIPVTMETRRGQALEVAASFETPPRRLDCANKFDASEVRLCVRSPPRCAPPVLGPDPPFRI